MGTPGSVSPTPTPAPDTTARPAVEVPGFRDVSQQADGTWRAVHVASGEPISAPTLERLETVEAPIVRLTHGWRAAS
ncbi:hypothetical protein [Nonomuraea jabiensis]|uniref:hypothetical protein n=1 Tax=Nonomuraea jabiensis TaxID=882448 RepID=UPI003D755F05